MRKLVSLLLALAMLATLMAVPAMAESAVEPMEVSVFCGDPRDQPASDNKIFKMIEEEFGLKFNFEFLAGDLNETLGVKIAGEDYADLMDGSNSAETLITNGALIDLMPYISEEKTPNIYTHIQPYLGRLLDDEGRLFIIPNYGRFYNSQEYGMQYVNGPAFFVQKQVLAWDNYPTIKTLDQYFDLIERFIAANPTKADGTPYEGFAILCEGWRGFCLWNPVQHLIGRPNDGDVYVDINDNYRTEAFAMADYAKPYYKKLNEMFKKGLINQDTFVMNYDQYIAKLTSGKVLGMFDQTWDFDTARDALLAAEMYENTFQGLPIVYDPHYVDGKEIEEHYLNGTVINVNRGFGISKNCKDPERLVNFFEAMLSDKWQTIIQWGIEGEDYYVENGRLLRTFEQIQNAADSTWKNKNSAYVLTNSMPHKSGKMDDGNCWDPLQQPENYFLQMNDYDKEFLGHYNMNRPLDFFADPIELAPYGEAWQIDCTVDTAANDAKQAYQDTERKYLPQLIMAPDDASFDVMWDSYVKACNDIPVSDFVDFMQQAILDLVAKNTK